MYIEFIVVNSAGLPLIESFRIDSDTDSEVRATIAYFVYYQCLAALDHRASDEYRMLDAQITDAQKNNTKISRVVLERHTELKTKMQTASLWLHSDVTVAASRSTTDAEKIVLWRGKLFEQFSDFEAFFESKIKLNECAILHTLIKPEVKKEDEKIELTDPKKAIPALANIALKQKVGSKK